MPPKPDPNVDAGTTLGLQAFAQPPQDAGLSLDKLSAALADMLNAGDDPYSASAPDNDAEPVDADLDGLASADPQSAAHQGAEISPKSILEALLFVGGSGNQPLTSQQVSSLMRGVRPAEIDSLVIELNAQYDARRCPYRIISEGAGYRLALRTQYAALRDKFFGRARQARLSQAAIEVLAAVSYHGPLTADEVSNLRGTPSGSILAQLVRRQLLQVERPQRKSAGSYSTTARFLELFGLSSLDDLPRSQDLESP